MSSNHLDGIGGLPKLDDLQPLGFTERELFTIYMKYSQGNPDARPADDTEREQVTIKKNDRPATSDERRSPQQKTGEGVGSSPASHNEHDYDSSQMTCSTAHTTPLKHWMMQNQARQQAKYIDFLAECSEYDLPSDTKAYFESLASQIVEIGGLLQGYQAQEDKEETEDDILDEAGVLLSLLESSARNCSDQVANIKWVQELAAFTLVPTDLALWSNYRQRVELVARHLAVPSTTEHTLLETLVQLHDAYILSPHLYNSTSTNPSHTRTTYPLHLRTAISALTTALHSLLNSYALWLRTLRRFRTTSLAPLLRRIQDSPWVRREIEQSETTIETARQNLHKRYQSGEMKRILKEDQLRGAQMLVERRSRSSVVAEELGGTNDKEAAGGGHGGGQRRLARKMTRVRREHTM